MRPPDPSYRKPKRNALREYLGLHDRGGRMSPGMQTPQRGIVNPVSVRRGARIAAQYDRPAPAGVQFPYVNQQPIVRRPLRTLDLHGGLQGHVRPHRFDRS